MDILSYVLGFAKGKAQGGASADALATLYQEQTVEGFAYDETFQAYVYEVGTPSFTLTVGKTYIIKWDDVRYECVAQDGSAIFGEGAVGIGNLSIFSLQGNNEPFVVGYINGMLGFISMDTQTSHKVGIYEQKTSASTDERVKYVTFMYGATELIKYPVISGDTVHDPVAKGLIETPTKESTVSTVYPYGGWSMTDGGAPDSSALNNVTEDRTVYAAFNEEARCYTVRFFDGETLVNTEQVPYGGSSDYRAEKEGWFFGYWSPVPENITGDMDCYAQWIESVDFATASWSEIAWVSENGFASRMFAIGDKRRIDFNGSKCDFEIIAFDHDDLADGSGKAGITMLCKALLFRHTSMNTTNTTTGGWGACTFRQTLSNKIATMPEDLQAIVKTVNKKYKDGNTTKIAEDKLWILSSKEVGIGTGDNLGSKYTSITDPTFGIQGNYRYYLRDIVTEFTTGYGCVLWNNGQNSEAKLSSASPVANSSWVNVAGHIIGFCI